MYYVTYMDGYEGAYNLYTAYFTDMDALFSFLTIIDKSRNISQFMVYKDFFKLSEVDFGWGKLNKWMNEIDFHIQRNVSQINWLED